MGPFKLKGEELKVSNIQQLCDVVMEEWKKIPLDTCKALLKSTTKMVEAVMENNGDHTKY